MIGQSVKLIAATKPVSSQGHVVSGPDAGTTLEQFVAFCARVSNPDNQGNHGTASKLLQYLARNAHWSPFEMAHAVIEITTTRDIARQILRHRSFSFQEFSQRYGAQTSFHPGRPLRWQDTKNRQNSIAPDNDVKTAALAHEWMERQQQVVSLARDNYEWALRQGIAKEVSRSVLPEGLTMSRLYMSGTLRSWIHYIQLRTDPATQLEHREIANLCAEALRPVYPGIEAFITQHFDPEVPRKRQVSVTRWARRAVAEWAAKEHGSVSAVSLEQVITENDGTTFVHINSHHDGAVSQQWFVRVDPADKDGSSCERVAQFPFPETDVEAA